MDIWRWVVDYGQKLADEGNLRLARLLMQLPEATCDDRHTEVDSLVPEALALVRALKHPWAEVYVRHWYLQSKVLHRHEVKESLPEAISLLEFASRPEARDCPQSVCVTQDLASTYGDIDGPGYAAERLAVARETLGRIDPTWPCFDCISGEYAAALCDDGKLEETLAFIEAQRQALVAHEIFELGGNLSRRRAMVLLELGRTDQAMAQLDEWETDDEGSHRELSKRILQARCLLRLGRLDEARDTLPGPKDVTDTAGLYEEWLTALFEFTQARVLANVWQAGRIVRQMQRKLDQNGAMYLSVWSAVHGAELALDRHATRVARMFIEDARARLGELRRPEVIADRFTAIERRVTGASEPTEQAGGAAPGIDIDIEALLAACGDDPEADLERLGPMVNELQREDVAPAMQAKDASRLVMQYTSALGVLGWLDRAERVMRAHLEHHPSDAIVLEALGQELLADGRHQALADLLDELEARDRGNGVTGRLDVRVRVAASWLRARSLHMRGKSDACRGALRALVAEAPGMDEAVLLLAQLERERGAHAEALALLEPLCAGEREPGSQDWDRMVVATLLGKWDVVRDSARRLGMDIPGEGPIDESGGICRVRIAGAGGQPITYIAERNSPVTARILQITGPASRDGGPESGRERFRDLIVFEPTPLERSKGSDASIHTFAAIEIMELGGYASYTLDGIHPGDAVFSVLEERIEDLGGAVQVMSGDDYELVLPGVEDESEAVAVRGIYAFVAVPGRVTPREFHEVLAESTAAWPHPITWLDLAEALGDDAELARQRDIAERYGL